MRVNTILLLVYILSVSNKKIEKKNNKHAPFNRFREIHVYPIPSL
jgi:hypothetical protein